MLTRLVGQLESIEPEPGHAATIRPAGAMGESLTLEVLLPKFLATRLATRVGETITLHTYFYLEGQGQGTSFEPRILGFASANERAFFDMFTTVKGIGNRKALRALAEEPGVIAAWIVRGDARSLATLPEIGKRLAETIIAELKGKVDAFAAADPLLGGAAARRKPSSQVEPNPSLTGAAADAVEALVRLGEQRAEAERKVLKTLSAPGAEKLGAEALIGRALGAR